MTDRRSEAVPATADEPTHPRSAAARYGLALRDGAIVLSVQGDLETCDAAEFRANLMVAEVIPGRPLVADLAHVPRLSAHALRVLESVGARLAVEGRRLVVVLSPLAAAAARRSQFAYPVATALADAFRILGLRPPIDIEDTAA